MTILNCFIYFLSFIMGTVFGSFCTLAVFRIPLKQDITHKRSYCVNCKHRLEFLDLIPIFSYIFLGGKCRYCGDKIRIRYLLLEILFGFSFMLFVMSLKFNWFAISIHNLVILVFGILYLVTLFIIAGIDKELKNIHKSVLIFGLVVMSLYIVYLYVVNINTYRYVIYLFLIIVLLIIDKLFFKEENYCLQLIALTFFMFLYTNKYVMMLTILFSIITAIFMKLIKKENYKNQAIGFYLCVYNIVFLILTNFIEF